MQQRVDELRVALRSDPMNREAMDELRTLMADSGRWEELYAFCGDLAERAPDLDNARMLWQMLLQALMAHIAQTDDPILASALYGRAARLLADNLEDPAAAVEMVRMGFEQHADASLLALAYELQQGSAAPGFLARLQEERAKLVDDGAERVELLESVVRLRVAAGAWEAADAALGSYRELAPEGAAGEELELAVAAMPGAPVSEQKKAVAKPGAKKPKSKTRSERKSEPRGAATLDELRSAWESTPNSDARGRALADALRGEGRWSELESHLEGWLGRASAADIKRDLARELAFLELDQLKNPTRGVEELRRAFDLGPQDEEVCSRLVDQLRDRSDWDELAGVYEKARRATRDRDRERELLLERARVLWRELGQLEEAEKIYRRLRAHPTSSEEALTFYEFYYEEQADWRRLYTTLAQRQGDATGAERIEIGVRMARVADERMENPDKAIEAWKRVLSWEPEHGEAQEELPLLFERTGKWHALLEFYNGRVGRLPEDAQEERVELLRRVVDIYESKDKLGVPEMVIHTYNRILQIDPGDGEAQEALCERYEAAGRWSELVGVLKQKLELAEDDDEQIALLKRIARLWRERIRNSGRAVEPLEAILALDPGDREALDALREIYRAKRSTEELYSVNRRALEVASDDERKELLRELATLGADRLHRHEEAVADWEALLELAPGDEEAVAALQKLYSRAGTWDRYVDLLNAQLAAAENDELRVELLGKLGQITFEKLRDYTAAKDVFGELSVLAPTHALARTYLQKIHIMQQSWDELEELYQDSGDWRSYIAVLNDHQERESDSEIKVQLNLQIAHIYEEHLNDSLRALKRYERARKIQPGNLDVARALAERYRNRKDRSRLSEVYETIAERSEDPVEVRQIQTELIDLARKMKKPAAAFRWCAAALPFDLDAGRLETLEELERLAEDAQCFDELAALYENVAADVDSDSVRLAVLLGLGGTLKDRLHDHGRAVEVFREAAELSPAEPAVLDALEELYIATSDFDGLEGVLRQRVDMAEDYEVIRENTLKLAQMYEDILADTDQSIECYQQLLDSDERDKAAIAGLKRVFDREERWSDLQTVLEQELSGTEEPAGRAALLFQLGTLQQTNLEDIDEAIESFRSVLEVDAEHAEARGALEALFGDGDHRQKVAPILEPIYRLSENWAALVEVLEVRLESADGPEDRADLLHEIAGLAENKLQDAERGYLAWRRLFVQSPEEEPVWDELQRLADVVGLWEDVAALFSAAVSFELGVTEESPTLEPLDDPTQDRQLTVRLAGIYEEQLEDFELAIGCHRKILDDDSDDLEALGALHRLYERGQDWDHLLEILSRRAELAWDADEKKGLYLGICALLREKLERDEDAIDFYRRVLELDEANREVMDELEGLFLAYERWDDLAELYKRRLMFPADQADASETRLQLGRVLRDQLESPDEAVDIFQAVLGDDGRRAEAIEALEGLLLDTDHDGHADFAPRVSEILEPLYRDAESWDSLVTLFQVRAELADEDFERARLLRAVGQIHEEKAGDDQAALASYSEAFLLAAGDDGVATDLDRVATRLEVWEDYAAVLENAIADGDAEPGPASVRRLARIYDEQLGDAAGATRHYEAIVDMEPGDIAALEALDRLYDAAAEPDKRAEVLRGLADVVDDEERQRSLWFSIGEIERDQDRVDDAIEAFTYVVERSADKQSELAVEAYGQLELLYELTERWDALIQIMLERYEYSEDLEERKTYLYRAAMTFEEQQESPDDAVALYVRALDLDPRDDVARAALRRLYEDTERWNELESLLTEDLSYAEEAAGRADILLQLGLLYEEQMEDGNRALQTYRELVEVDPEGEAGVEALGRILGDPDYGFEASRVLVGAHERAGRRRELADVLELQLDRFEDEIDPQQTLFRLAGLREDEFADGDGAFACYAKAFQREHTDQRAWDALVRLAADGDRWEGLFEVFDGVLADLNDATDRIALRLRVAALHGDVRGDAERAEAIYWEVLEDEPEHGESLDALEQIYVTAENWERLAEVLRRKIDASVELDQRTALSNRLGRLLQDKLERSEEAAAAFEEVLGLEPTDAEAFSRLESIYAANEDWDAAVDLLERKVSVLVDTDAMCEALRALAQIQYLEREERDTAIDVLARLLDLRPGDEDGVGTLEAIYAEGYARDRIADILEPIFLQQKAWPKLVALYRGHLEDEDLDDHTRGDRLRAIYRIMTEELDDDRGAFDVLAELLRLSPDDNSLHRNAEAVSERLDNWGELAHVYRALLDDDCDDELAIALALRLARIEEERLQDRAAAIEQYRQVIERREDHAGALEALERLLSAAEDWAALVALADHVADTTMEPAAAVAACFKGAALLRDRLDDLEGAAERLLRVIEQQPESREAYQQAEVIYEATESHEELESLYRTWLNVLGEPEERAAVQLRLGRVLIEQRDAAEEGIELFRDLFVLVPRHPGALEYLEARLDEVPADSAAEALRREIVDVLEPVYDEQTAPERWVSLYMAQLEFAEEMDRRAEILRKIGDVYLTRSEDPQAAFEFYGQAFAMDFGNEALENDLERIAEGSGLWDDLVGVYADGLALSDDDFAVDRYLLKCARIARDKLSDPLRSAEFYERVLEREPGNEEAIGALESQYAEGESHEKLSRILELKLDLPQSDDDRTATMLRLADLASEQLGDQERAEGVYRDILAEVPDCRHAMDRLESIAIGRGDWESLVDIYQAMLRFAEEEQEHVDLLSRTAQVFETQLERFDDAVQCYNDIFSYQPDNLYAVTSLERIYRQTEDWDGLLQVLRKRRGLSENQEERAKLDYDVGMLLLEELGSKSEAIVSFARTLQVLPEHDGAITALELLVEDADYCLEAARILKPVFERAEAWERVVPLILLQAELSDEPPEQAALFEKAATLQIERLGDLEAGFDSLGMALSEHPSDTALLDRLLSLAKERAAWTPLAETLAQTLEHIEDETCRRALALELGRVREERLDDAPGAIVAYEEALAVDEFNRTALAALDRLLESQERWPELAEVLQREIGGDAGDDALRLKFRLAALREERLDDQEGSLELFREVLWEQPDHEDAISRMEGLARQPALQEAAVNVLEPLYRQQERWRALTSLLRLRADGMEPGEEREHTLCTVAELYEQRLDDVQNAFETYARALGEGGGGPEIVRELDRIADEHGLWPRFAVALEEALAGAESEEVQLDLQMRLGGVYMTRLKNSAKAEGHLRAVLAADPESLEALRLLEEAYETAGNLDELVRVCEMRAQLPIDVDERKGLYRKIASVSEMRNEDEGAVAAYEAILDLDPGDAEALERLEGIHEGREDWEALVVALDRRAEFTAGGDELAAVKLRIGEIAEVFIGEPERAIVSYESALDLRPDWPDALEALERLYGQLERWEEMRDVLERRAHVAEEAGERVELLSRAAALSEREMEDVPQALSLFRDALSIEPDNAEVVAELARLYQVAEQWPELVEMQARQHELSEDEDERRQILVESAGVLERNLHDYDGAMGRLQAVLDETPDHTQALMGLGRLKESMEDWSEAVSIYERLLPQSEDERARVELLGKLGRVCLVELEDRARARDFLVQAREIEPANPVALELLAQVFRAAEEWEPLKDILEESFAQAESDDAKVSLAVELADIYGAYLPDEAARVVWLEEAYAIEPERREVLVGLVEHYEAEDDTPRVAELLTRLVDILVERRELKHVAEYAYKLGAIREAAGDTEDALEAYRLSRKHDASRTENLMALGRLLFEGGHDAEALKVLQALLLQQNKLESDQLADLFLKLSEICLRGGDEKRARQYVGRLLRIQPKHERGLEIKEQTKK